VDEDNIIRAAMAEGEMENAKPGKRKRDSADQEYGNAKLKEYLHVMQPPSKLMTWSNEDITTPQGATYSALKAPKQNTTTGGQNDGDSASVLKTPREAVRQDELRIQLYSSEGESTTGVVLDIKGDVIPEKKSLPLNQQLQVTSDGDWLRSRTSNLVDLVGTDGAITSISPLEIDEGSAQDPIVSRQLPKRAMSDLAIQTDLEPVSQLSASIGGSENATGRLFVRNLAYSSTEDELREYFTSQGPDSIKDVRPNTTFHFSCVIIYLVILLMNSLIGTTYAWHMMLPGEVF
jgi:multiple RNA-binding domain-containing protein 1